MHNNEEMKSNANDYYEQLNQKLDNVMETMNEFKKQMPKIREQVAELHAKISSGINPSIAAKVDNITCKGQALTAKIEANLQEIASQKEKNRAFQLAKMKCKASQSK